MEIKILHVSSVEWVTELTYFTTRPREHCITLNNLSGIVRSRVMTILVITGAPGIGKTTAVIHIARTLKDKGINVGGIVSRELRFNNMRVGF